MDFTKIPYFAMFRRSGTVIVRVKMDGPESFCKPEACPRSDYPQPVHRPSGCEECSRTRSNSRNSDCDSDLVERCGPYRASSARSRYVNVCAAVCLVLLVGGLAPQSTAAPYKRTMDRQRRSAQENSLWGNPCDYDSNSKSAKYTAKLAKDVASQAKNAYESTAKYKDKFALKLHSYPSFDELLTVWSSDDWLRNFTWFPEEGLPKEKVLYQAMPAEYMDKLIKKIDKILPSMFKGLKMVVAGLYSITKEGLNDDIFSDASMKHNITESMHNVRAVLCLFDEIMRSRNLEIMPLPDSEIPDMKNVDKLSYALLVYRDTLNYLEYLAQVFQTMYDMDPDKAD
ncbi:uncharacterized protein LOC126772377 [Nymphalis io]|uniref:uncharacterized protein LOC126772377 n=1 Tax=Inachis io TaxID=171585 RepID=UPI0021670507|nr:uncharacterized protein LOC126772377 [Nymphalis io]